MRVVIAGILAGLGMAFVMGIGERLALAKINLPMIDGRFFLKDRLSNTATYLVGLLIHMVTSITFAVGYIIFKRIVPIPMSNITSGIVWAFILWVAFGLTVSPVTGYGLFGSKAGQRTWLELLFTHLVFGLILCFLV